MKLYRLRYSPYARKVQMLLDLLRRPYELIEVSYGDRNELATLTGGYIYVPVLVDDAGKVLCESRAICGDMKTGAWRNFTPAAFSLATRALVPRGDAVV